MFESIKDIRCILLIINIEKVHAKNMLISFVVLKILVILKIVLYFCTPACIMLVLSLYNVTLSYARSISWEKGGPPDVFTCI